MKKLVPAIGYKGGKRAEVPRLLRYFDLTTGDTYVAPFAGMDALYHQLRANGFNGPAVLCESNPVLRSFWEFVHDPIAGRELVRIGRCLQAYPTTQASFERLREQPVDGHERVIHFLWLTNFSFANNPAQYVGSRWVTHGSKMAAVERGEKSFPWNKCVDRLESICTIMANKPIQVHGDGMAWLSATNGDEHIYADPPYEKSHNLGYGDGGELVGSYIEAVIQARAKCVVLSEKRDLRTLLPEWDVDVAFATQRASNGVGAEGRRAEFLYIKRSADHRRGGVGAT